MVYDVTKSGVNGVTWAPNFFLPSIDSVLRTVGPSSFLADIDLGEHFLNYPLHESIQPFFGVNVTGIVKRKDGSDSHLEDNCQIEGDRE